MIASLIINPSHIKRVNNAKTFALLLFFVLVVLHAVGQTAADGFYVFVGEKISVEQFRPPTDSGQFLFNAAFKARYKILQNVYNSYQHDTIEFEAYDHYGVPPFSKYQHVLLFVSEKDGKLYHEKYQFFPLYKTRSGRWASPYSGGDYSHEYNKSTSIKPEKVEFVEKISETVDFSKWSNREAIKTWYPSPYYRIKGNEVTAVWGNYVEQLFELKRNGILRARGIF